MPQSHFPSMSIWSVSGPAKSCVEYIPNLCVSKCHQLQCHKKATQQRKYDHVAACKWFDCSCSRSSKSYANTCIASLNSWAAQNTSMIIHWNTAQIRRSGLLKQINARLTSPSSLLYPFTKYKAEATCRLTVCEWSLIYWYDFWKLACFFNDKTLLAVWYWYFVCKLSSRCFSDDTIQNVKEHSFRTLPTPLTNNTSFVLRDTFSTGRKDTQRKPHADQMLSL